MGRLGACDGPVNGMDAGLYNARNADGIVEQDDGSLLFVEPHQTQENFITFVRYVQEDCSAPVPLPPDVRNVKYAQTRTLPLFSEKITRHPLLTVA
jgi:hypothetical protein